MIKFIEENDYFRLSKAYYKKGYTCLPHSHPSAAISVVLNGLVHEEVDKKSEIGRSAVTIIKPAQIEHQNIFTEDCTILCLYLKDMQLKKLRHGDLLKEWTWLNGINCLPFFIKILKSKTSAQIHQATNELLHYISFSANEHHLQTVPGWLLDVKAYIDNFYYEPLCVMDLAKKSKVHRVYLARVFQKYYGQNIKAYQSALRLHHSAAAIIKDTSISDAAFANGFSDQAHLQRKFQETLQCTPASFRNLLK